MPIQNSTFRAAEPPLEVIDELASPCLETSDKIHCFFTRIEGMVTVFSLLAGAVVAALWGVPLGLIAGGAGLAVAAAIAIFQAPPAERDIEAEIKAVTPDEINLIAKRIGAKILDLLKIDIDGDKYNPASRLLALLVPVLADQIKESFQDPEEFIESGLKFTIYDSYEETADSVPILTEISDEYGFDALQNAADHLMDRLDKEFLLLDMFLWLELAQTRDADKLSFSLEICTDDSENNLPYNQIENIDFTIDQCARLAEQTLV